MYIEIQREKCIHCGACMQYCPEHAIITAEGRAMICQELCTKCASCIKACYMLAIEKKE